MGSRACTRTSQRGFHAAGAFIFIVLLGNQAQGQTKPTCAARTALFLSPEHTLSLKGNGISLQ